MSGKRKVLIIVTSIVGAIVLAGAGVMIWLTRGLSTYTSLEIMYVDMSDVPDGTYEGSAEGGRWSNTVRVTVAGNRITSIDVVKDVMISSAEVSRELFSTIMEEQSLDVDTVTGATATSNAYLKSIEDALAGAR